MVEIVSVKPKTVKKSVSFRVAESTARELESLRNRAKDAGDEVDFRLDEAVDKQLLKFIKTANQQFDHLTSPDSFATPATHSVATPAGNPVAQAAFADRASE